MQLHYGQNTEVIIAKVGGTCIFTELKEGYKEKKENINKETLRTIKKERRKKFKRKTHEGKKAEQKQKRRRKKKEVKNTHQIMLEAQNFGYVMRESQL